MKHIIKARRAYYTPGDRKRVFYAGNEAPEAIDIDAFEDTARRQTMTHSIILKGRNANNNYYMVPDSPETEAVLQNNGLKVEDQ